MRVLLTSLLLLQSCSDVSFPSGNSEPGKQNPVQVQAPAQVQNPQPATQPSQPVQNSETSSFVPTVAEYEGVSVPNTINGVLLHCGVVMDARDGLTNSMVGCRFEDAAGLHI